MTQTNYWDLVVNRDGRLDGRVYYAVTSTGVYCRPSCHSRLPKRENVLFFERREEAERAGFRACKRCRPEDVSRVDPRVEMAEKACRYIDAHLDGPVTLAALGEELGLSSFHVQRTFKSLMGITPRAYADSRRAAQMKGGLLDGQTVTAALYDAGYSSPSRLYERTDSQLGMTPSKYKKGGEGSSIRYSIVDSPFGRLLVASTTRGICSIQFGDSDAVLVANLRAEFRSAEIVDAPPDDATAAILDRLRGNSREQRLPLDIQATAFQRLVWEHLQSIPRGRTETYSQVAQAIGKPSATRAVARACATNRIAVAIPCHRVVRSDGELSGYRWGAERKKAILAAESAHSD